MAARRGLNIVTIFVDDMITDGLELLPYLTSWPDGHWVQFPNAKVSQPLCTPSRTTMLTGQYGPSHGITTNNFGPFADNPAQLDRTIFKVMRQAGYATGSFGKLANDDFASEADLPAGLSAYATFDAEREYYNYSLRESAYGVNSGAVVEYGTGANDHSTDVFAARTVSFIEAAPEPFFVHVAPYTPHHPNTPADRHVGDNAALAVTLPANGIFEDDLSTAGDYRVSGNHPQWVQDVVVKSEATIVARVRKIADAMIALDEMVEDIMDALTARGVLDRTVIFFLTDNSNHKGEQGFALKGSPYESAITAQMVVRWPSATQGVNDALACNVDLPATFCAIAGAHMDWAHDGMDLSPVILGDVEPGDFRGDLFILQGPQVSDVEPWFGLVTADGWKYVEYPGTGEASLFDLSTDPGETASLITAPDETWRSRLDRIKPPGTDTLYA